MSDILKQKYIQYKIGDKSPYVKLVMTDENESLLDFIASLLNDDTGIIELCQGKSSAGEFLQTAEKVKLLCAQFDAAFIVNERLDVACLSEADGVFLTSKDIDIHSARKILGENCLIGTFADENLDADFYISEDSGQDITPDKKHFVYITHIN